MHFLCKYSVYVVYFVCTLSLYEPRLGFLCYVTRIILADQLINYTIHCRYNHNAKFSLLAKMSVYMVTFSFIMFHPANQENSTRQFYFTALSSISYRSLLLLVLLISLIFCFVPLRHFRKNHYAV